MKNETRTTASTMNPLERKNYNGIDIFKFIMAIFVVAIHTEPFYYCSSDAVRSTVSTLTGLAVPFFFISSGFLLGRKFEEPYCSRNNQKAVAEQLKKL